MSEPLTIAPDCLVEIDGRRVLIGDDLHMNGLDAPASLRTPEEARKLIAHLETLIAKWPKGAARPEITL